MPELTFRPRTVRHGAQVLRFQGALLGAASSTRPGAARWSELTVYRLANGNYIIAKVGRSTVAHLESCRRADADRMVRWIEAGEEGRVRRVPCPECQPEVGDRMDPLTLLETSRYTVLQAHNPEDLYQALRGTRATEGRPPVVVSEVLRQVANHDPVYAAWAATGPECLIGG